MGLGDAPQKKNRDCQWNLQKQYGNKPCPGCIPTVHPVQVSCSGTAVRMCIIFYLKS